MGDLRTGAGRSVATAGRLAALVTLAAGTVLGVVAAVPADAASATSVPATSVPAATPTATAPPAFETASSGGPVGSDAPVQLDPSHLAALRSSVSGSERTAGLPTVPASAVRPAASAPLTGANLWIIPPGGNASALYDPVVSATGRAGGTQLDLTAKLVPDSISFSFHAPAQLATGVYSTGDPGTGAVVNSSICSPAPAVGLFKIDQIAWDGMGNPTAAAVEVDLVCPGSGAELIGTIAFQMANSTPNQGYYSYDQFGDLFGFGNDNYLAYLGDPGFLYLNAPILSMVTTPSGSGYWMMGQDGGIFAYGDANFYGSTGGMKLNEPAVGMAATPDGGGYWFVASDGGVFSYGDANFYGSMGGQPLAAPVVGMATRTDGQGYYLVASDGGIFAFDAPFQGSMGGQPLYRPVVGLAVDPSSGGYWEVASDGGIFSFNAPFHGSTGGMTLAQPIVGMLSTSDGNGYWLTASDGGIFAYNAPFYGSVGGHGLTDIAGMAI
jgi:hypothetical protein